MFESIENRFAIVSEYELVQYKGGGGRWDIHLNLHKVIDSAGRFFSGIYNAGRQFGKNWYNANN
ncbi:bacteriocin leader domain-containing protein [Streptococcus ruminantium]|uniref:Bacteriocin leader domain-containing protein n=1 Tax=Streptococcus ruminantium TaxID=1917441 RepID=A0ABU1B4D8_9STRE|nr:bacteriocin leader domain-containing protein [Streptococcus ruminantium]MDQ8760208.1 bacteriocin leader domain-containing protein [Streptococcus ruminantium]MDQ8765676.1 bacteriocin leader domain-containing protein [Streptococcus ruminantium]MDQ8766863.1 bacteriocin leader domain-containing protein [Streptococcus ruminantium]MDQ8769872.1 bacteriocin leader domain-containing protein [Streptococcus ruminantium]MDQ8775453.1 bacteriocin leader domain-containing protein [Streptococcus ruminantiu